MFKCRFEEKQHVRGSNQANNLLPCGPYLKEIFTLEHVCSNGIRCGQSVVPDVPKSQTQKPKPKTQNLE